MERQDGWVHGLLGSETLPCKDETYSNTVRVIGDEGEVLDTSTATVTVTCSTTPPVVPPTVVPPTVVPPTPVVDIGVTKSATTPTRLNGNVTYTIVVSSLGPDPANGVEVKDPAPGFIQYSSARSSDATVTCNVVENGAPSAATGLGRSARGSRSSSRSSVRRRGRGRS